MTAEMLHFRHGGSSSHRVNNSDRRKSALGTRPFRA
jgi:hypothetical protein